MKCILIIEIIEIEIFLRNILEFVKNQFNLYNCKHFPLYICTLYTYIANVYVCFQMHIHYPVYFHNFI